VQSCAQCTSFVWCMGHWVELLHFGSSVARVTNFCPLFFSSERKRKSCQRCWHTQRCKKNLQSYIERCQRRNTSVYDVDFFFTERCETRLFLLFFIKRAPFLLKKTCSPSQLVGLNCTVSKSPT
jgi:hypothetical protein